MYMIINKNTGKTIAIKETTATANYLDVERSTIYRRFEHSNKWEDSDWVVYKADKTILRSGRAGNNKKCNI